MAHASSVSAAGRQLQVQHDYMLINWQGRELCLAWCPDLEEAKRTVVSDLGKARSIDVNDVAFCCQLGGRRVELLESAWKKLAPLTPIELVIKSAVQKKSKKVTNAPQVLQQQNRRSSAVDIDAWRRGQVGHPYSSAATGPYSVNETRSFITPSPPLSDAQSSSQRGPSPSQEGFPSIMPDLMPDTDPSPASSVQNLHILHMQVEQAPQKKAGKTGTRPVSTAFSNSTDSLATSSSFFEEDGIASPAFKQIGARLGVAAGSRSPAKYITAAIPAANVPPYSSLHRKTDSITSLAEVDRDSPFSVQSGESVTATERTPQRARNRQSTRSIQRASSSYPFIATSSKSDDLDLTDYQSRRASMPAAIPPSMSSAETLDPWYLTGLIESLPDTKAAPPLPKIPSKVSGPGSPSGQSLRRLKSTPVGLNAAIWAESDDHSPPPFAPYERPGNITRSEAATWPDPVIPLTTGRFGDLGSNTSLRPSFNLPPHILGDYLPIANHKRPDSPMPFVTRSLPASPGLRTSQSTLVLSEADSSTGTKSQHRPRTKSFQAYEAVFAKEGNASRKLLEPHGSSKRHSALSSRVA